MSDFVVSALKYRPQDWGTVVGQSAITDTLDNAIASEKLAHAYLFCGPRGVGKTTCARIFAKKINQKELNDPNEDFAFNVFELDAASNNSVEDIRSLTEQVRIPPQKGSYKVYVIDEVHMLSTQAFNAFLKTLEEPPSHAIFILATTEKHKILPTILSRCQIYDFNRISVEDITNHLKNIAGKENIQFEEEALISIAKKADGALRDALSIFDQVASFSQGNITMEMVVSNLGILEQDIYFKIVDATLNEDIKTCMLTYHEVINRGFDSQQFLLGLTEHFRNLIMSASDETLTLIESSAELKANYKEQLQKTNTGFILDALEILGNADGQYRQSKNKRLLSELTLMQLCSIKAMHLSNDKQEKKKSSSIAIIPPNGIEIDPPAVNIENITPGGLPNQVNRQVANAKSVQATPKQAAPMQAAPKPDKKRVKKPSFSITGAISGTQEKQTAAENAQGFMQTKAAPVNQGDIERVWNKFAYKVKTDGNLSFYTTLSARKPKLEKNVIHFSISNAVQEQDFSIRKAEILEFLRTQLNNFQLQIEWKLDKAEVGANLYTPTQKFNKMAETNPHLNTLRDKFNLDIDF